MRKVVVKKNGRRLWNAFAAGRFAEKTIGLMFKNKAFPLLFEFDSQGTFRNAIHSLFCPPFDAVFLNSEKRVVFILKNVGPFKPFLRSPKPNKFLLELPPGEARKLRVGEKLDW